MVKSGVEIIIKSDGLWLTKMSSIPIYSDSCVGPLYHDFLYA